MKKVYQIFTLKHYGHRGFGAPNGSSVEILPLWEDAYGGKVHEFDTEEDAGLFIKQIDPVKNQKVDLVVLPVYKKI
jgi:hypothetical protein